MSNFYHSYDIPSYAMDMLVSEEENLLHFVADFLLWCNSHAKIGLVHRLI